MTVKNFNSPISSPVVDLMALTDYYLLKGQFKRTMYMFRNINVPNWEGNKVGLRPNARELCALLYSDSHIISTRHCTYDLNYRAIHYWISWMSLATLRRKRCKNTTNRLERGRKWRHLFIQKLNEQIHLFIQSVIPPKITADWTVCNIVVVNF